MIYVGIDPSINSTGLTVDDGSQQYFYLIKPNLTKQEQKYEHAYSNFQYILYLKDNEKTDIYWKREYIKLNNFLNIVKKIKEIIDSFEGIKIICIEGISYGSRSSNLTDLAGLNWLIRQSLQEHNLYVFSPSSVKKFFTGNGNANKEMMVNIFRQIYPFNLPKIDDVADSYALMEMGKEQKYLQ